MIPITKINLGNKESQAIAKVLQSGWIMNGPVTEKYENKICQYTGAKYATAVSSGTAALHLSLIAAGINQNSQVITPSHSFVSSAYVVNHLKATPVFCDVDPRTYNMTLDLIKKKLSSKTKAIILVHQFGLPCDLDPIYHLAKKHNLIIIEDAACALGSQYKNRPIGQKGDFVCFSFHPRKIITTAEGGMILTKSKTITTKLKSLRNHGLINNRLKYLGLNCRLTDIQSAIGLIQLSKLEKFLKKRTAIANRYCQALSNHPLIKLPHIPRYATPNWQSYAITFQKPTLRNKALEILKKHHIYAKEGIPAIHKQPLFKNHHPSLPNTEYLQKSQLLLPIYPTLTQKEQNYIINTLCRLIPNS